jgi:uncharacterized protein YraI
LPPTEPPAEMPTPEELKPFVTVGSVDLFDGPSTDDEVVGTLSPGESLEIMGRNADSSWWQVSTPDGLAWVAANVVTASNADDRIPIVGAPSPPIQGAIPAFRPSLFCMAETSSLKLRNRPSSYRKQSTAAPWPR